MLKRPPRMPLAWRYDRFVEKFYVRMYPLGPLYLLAFAVWVAFAITIDITFDIRLGR